MHFKLRRGTLTTDPEIKETRKGIMALVSLAEDHSRPVYEGDEIVDWERTGVSYYDCVFFDEMAEEIAHFHKGEHIEVTDGTIKQNKWEDDQGVMHYDYRFYVNDFEQFIPGGD